MQPTISSTRPLIEKKYSTQDFPSLECPLCERITTPRGVSLKPNGELRHVTYSCPPDHINHGNRYKWKILPDGDMID